MQKTDNTLPKLFSIEIFLLLIVYIVFNGPIDFSKIIVVICLWLILIIPVVFSLIFFLVGTKKNWDRDGYKVGLIINLGITTIVVVLIGILSNLGNLTHWMKHNKAPKFDRIMIGVFSFIILGLVGAIIGFFIHPFEGNFGRLSGQEFLFALLPYILVSGGIGVALSYFFPKFMMFIIDLLFGGKFSG